MKVRELLGYFINEDGKTINKDLLDKEILMSSDTEGNTFHGVQDIADDGKDKLIIWPDDEYIEDY